MTDLCWECQRNNRDISSSSNLPDVVKQAHLDLVFMERTFYQNMVKDAKAAYTASGCPPLGPHPPCSIDSAVHLSFDYAQQEHLPSFPMQPGPLYFLVPRKVGIFGVCMEGISWQINYLIDESHCSSKGSNAVISYLHHYFENYGLGEQEVNLHCDNCSGQNKNQCVLAYLMWRVVTGSHKSISLNFLITGHTKFAPDWCFGLLKQKSHKEPVSSLKEMEATVRRSTLQEVNIAQLVEDERGTVFVPMYDWQAFLIPFSKAVKGIKQYHHFSFSHQAQGVMMATPHAEGPTQILPVLVGDVGAVSHAPPPWVQSPGLSAYRQWYLFNSIRYFCTDNTKDVMCPKPTVPQPGPAPPTRQIAAPLPQDETDPEGGGDAPARGRGLGRGCGRGRGHGRGQGRGRGRGWGRGGAAQRESDSESSSTLEEEEEEEMRREIDSPSPSWSRSRSPARLPARSPARSPARTPSTSPRCQGHGRGCQNVTDFLHNFIMFYYSMLPLFTSPKFKLTIIDCLRNF